jgi:hypothetical protein
LKELEKYDRKILSLIGDNHVDESSLVFKIDSDKLTQALVAADNNGSYEPFKPRSTKEDADEYDEETYHRLTSAEVVLPRGDFQFIAKGLG